MVADLLPPLRLNAIAIVMIAPQKNKNKPPTGVRYNLTYPPEVWSIRWSTWPQSRPRAAPERREGTKRPVVVHVFMYV